MNTALFVISLFVFDLVQSSNLNSIKSFQRSKVHIDNVKLKIKSKQTERLLQMTAKTSKPDFVISEWIKKYPSRNEICRYLCQSDSFFGLSSSACYVSYECSSIILQNLIFWIILLSYTILPVVMVLIGIWKFGCWSDHLAVLTGIVFINMIYRKLSRNFEEDMETDYDISNSEVESDLKQNSSENSN